MGNKLSTKNLDISGYETYLTDVEKIMLKFTNSSSPKIKNSAQRVIKAGGKRLRPILVIATAKCFGEKVSIRTLYAAAAVELVHLATLVHDDIIDESNVRWGAPTVNAIEVENHAIVLGDYLLSLASLVACEAGIEITKIINQACVDVCDGQSTETTELFNTERTIDSYLKSTKYKTASLISASCRAGAVSAGATTKQAEHLGRFGENFGISYQMIDDLMDLFSTSEVMKKPVGNDVKEGNYTYAVLLAFAKDENLKKNISKMTQTEIADYLRSDNLEQVTLEKINFFMDKAIVEIKKAGNIKSLDNLTQIPQSFLNWAKVNL